MLAAAVLRVAGIEEHPIEHLPARRGEVNRNFARYDRALDILGFKPTHNLELGLRKTWEWFQTNRESILGLHESDA